MAITPLVPRIAVRAARRKVPVGLVAAVDDAAARPRQGGRLDEVLDELERVRLEAGSPPLAAPIGQIVASQALVNVLGANRYGTIVDELRELVSGRFGRTPGPIDPAPVRARRAARAGRRRAGDRPGGAARAGRRARGERGGAAAARALRRRGGAAAALDPPARRAARRPCPSRHRARSRRADPRGRPDRPGDGDRRDHGRGGRDARQRPPHASTHAARGDAPTSTDELDAPASRRPATGWCGSRARWSAPSTARRTRTRRRSSQEGDPVSAGQTLCILEAMKLMNEVKAEIEGIVRRDPRRQRGAGRVRPAAVRARARQRPPGRDLTGVQARPGREPRRDRRPRDPRAARARRARRSPSTRPPTATRCTSGSPTRRLRRPARCGRELPAHPVDRRRRGHDRLRGGASRATASSPRTRRSSRRAPTTTSSSSGRRADVMTTMGDKIAARAAMRDAGVPTVPGTDGATSIGRGPRAPPTSSATRSC